MHLTDPGPRAPNVPSFFFRTGACQEAVAPVSIAVRARRRSKSRDRRLHRTPYLPNFTLASAILI